MLLKIIFLMNLLSSVHLLSKGHGLFLGVFAVLNALFIGFYFLTEDQSDQKEKVGFTVEKSKDDGVSFPCPLCGKLVKLVNEEWVCSNENCKSRG